MNDLDHAILKHMNAINTLQNRPASYKDLPGFEVSGRKFVIADGTFRNKISGFGRQGLVRMVYNSKVAFYSLTRTKRFQQYIQPILLTALMMKGCGF